MKPREITPHRASLLVAEGRLTVKPVDGRLALVDPRHTEGALHTDNARRFFADLLASAERIVPGAGGESDRLVAVLPDASVRWFTDPMIVYELLTGHICAGEDAFTGARAQRVEVAQPAAFSDTVRDERLRVCRAEWCRDSGEAIRSSWFVRDHNENGSAPSQQLGRSLHRLRDSLIALGGDGCRVGITRRGAAGTKDAASAVPNGKLTRIVTEGWTAYWPVAALWRVVALIAGVRTPRRLVDDQRNSDRLFAQGALRIIFSSIGRNGPAALSYRHPRTASERRCGYATATVARLVSSGYTGTQRLVDSAYRSGDRYALFVTLYRYSGKTWRTAFDTVLGTRRKDALPREPASRGPLPVWDRYATAVEEFLRLFATQIHRRGGATDASAMDIVARYYLRPRTDAMRTVWERACRDTRIDTMLEDGRLSILRELGRLYPRRTLVEAVAGRTEAAKRRVAAIFSRNGRAIFLEDVEAVEAAIERRDAVSWERLLASQGVLSRIAHRIRYKNDEIAGTIEATCQAITEPTSPGAGTPTIETTSSRRSRPL